MRKWKSIHLQGELLVGDGFLQVPLCGELLHDGTDRDDGREQRQSEGRPPVGAAQDGCLRNGREHNALEHNEEPDQLVNLVADLAALRFLHLAPLREKVKLCHPLIKRNLEFRVIPTIELQQVVGHYLGHDHLLLIP